MVDTMLGGRKAVDSATPPEDDLFDHRLSQLATNVHAGVRA